MKTPKEGFWGRVNPFARKKWVKRQTDAINDRLSELDDVNAKNANDIRDVDGRAQAGIHRLSPPPTQPTRPQPLPGSRLNMAGNTANGASNHVNQLNSTVNGLDQYHQVTEAEIAFRSGLPTLSAGSQKAT
jgi:hypothetical protein